MLNEVDIKENTMDMKRGNSGAASSHKDRKKECTDCSCGITNHYKAVCKHKDIPWLKRRTSSIATRHRTKRSRAR